ncbi:hypothetical protein ACFL26_02040 [Patescibacteria group bacterium]
MPKVDLDIERRKVRAMFIMLGTVILGIGLFMFLQVRTGDTKGTIASGVILALILGLMAPILKSGYDNVRRGLPMKDERTRRVETKAAAIAFYVNIYVLLAIGVFGDSLPTHSATALAILSSALVFLVGHVVLSRSSKI